MRVLKMVILAPIVVAVLPFVLFLEKGEETMISFSSWDQKSKEEQQAIQLRETERATRETEMREFLSGHPDLVLQFKNNLVSENPSPGWSNDLRYQAVVLYAEAVGKRFDLENLNSSEAGLYYIAAGNALRDLANDEIREHQ